MLFSSARGLDLLSEVGQSSASKVSITHVSAGRRDCVAKALPRTLRV